MSETPLLTGATVYDCTECRGRGKIRNRTCHGCQGRRVVIVQSGRVVKLLPLDAKEPEKLPGPPKPPIVTTQHRRQIDSRCIACNSPDLATRQHCEACAKIHNERTTDYHRRRNRLT